MLKVIYMGTPEFAVPGLKAVIESHQVLAVYSQPDRPAGRGLKLRPTPVKAVALENDIPVQQPDRIDRTVLDHLRSLEPDVIVVAAYGKILPQALLDIPNHGCINIHSSLLPRWRGAAPIQWAILGGDQETGVCTMRIVKQLDAGDVALFKKTDIEPGDTSATLHDRLAQMSAPLILETLEALEAGELNFVKQDESRVTYASKLEKTMGYLKPSDSAVQADRKVRGLVPWPGTFVFLDQIGRIRILEARHRPDCVGREGELFLEGDSLVLGFSDGALELVRIQPDGRKPVDQRAFQNGLRGSQIKFPIQWRSCD